MTPIRVHLGPMPVMLRTIISDLLAAEPGVEIVGSADRESSSIVAAGAQGADVLLTEQPSQATDPILTALVEARPHTILVLRPERESCLAVTLTHREVPLDSEGMAGLVTALRKAAQP